MNHDRVLRLICLAALVLLLAGCARQGESQAVILITPAPTEPAPSTAPARGIQHRDRERFSGFQASCGTGSLVQTDRAVTMLRTAFFFNSLTHFLFI